MFKTNTIAMLTGCLMLTGLSSVALADSLQPFRSDGCSSFPDGTLQQNTLWLRCCYQHDLSYWQGGTELQRLVADHDLEQCVRSVGEPKVAMLMLAGVRVGGSPYFPTPYRWGYGWSYLRGYKPLNATEKMQVRQMLKNIPPPALPQTNQQILDSGLRRNDY